MEKHVTSLLFGVHMHQPVDNFDEAVERAVESCYAPFFATMRKYPEFRFALHCSGWLLQKIKNEYGDLFDDMLSLSREGSVEILTAGFYEPVLSSIPSSDRVAQIRKLSESVEKSFAQRPDGLWLTERVWESGIVPDIVKAGVKYAIVDDYHFISAGFDKEVLDGFFMSEEGGAEIALFPISQALRYAIPFKPVEGAIEAIKACTHSGGGAAVIFDDAEKFGMWPGTNEWVHRKGWLRSFVESVLEDEEIQTRHYREYLSKNRAKGVAYLPSVSYYEMGEWSLKADDALALERLRARMGEERFEREGIKFLKGGIWKNFFVKYDESNRLHKRMLECSAKGIDTPEYKDRLHRLQTNDVFWHGVFGGLYLPNLRDNAYRYLIECENMRYGASSALERADTDLDGYEEVKWVGREIIARFDSRYGGQMVEFCDREKLFNFQNVLTRRKEAYHEKIAESGTQKREAKPEEEGISTIHTAAHRADEKIREALVYDWYVKNSFIDHISDHSLDVQTLRKCSFKELSDFANQPFEMRVDSKSAAFERRGGIYDYRKFDTLLKKRYDFQKNGFDFTIELESESPHIYEYGVELNLHFANLEDVELESGPIGTATLHELRSFEMSDSYTGRLLRFETDHYFSLLTTELQTVSQSEEGFELMTQGVTVMAVFPFSKRLSIRGSLKVLDV